VYARDFVRLVDLYEDTQNKMDLNACINLFDDGAIVRMPMGSGANTTHIGKQAVKQAYASFFGGLKSLHEKLTSKLFINEWTVGYTKNITAQLKSGAWFSTDVICIFRYLPPRSSTADSKIKELDLLWTTGN